MRESGASSQRSLLRNHCPLRDVVKAGAAAPQRETVYFVRVICSELQGYGSTRRDPQQIDGRVVELMLQRARIIRRNLGHRHARREVGSSAD